MVIAVENGLESVKKALLAQGYDVVDLESGKAFHAAVYVNRGIMDIPAPKAAAVRTAQDGGIFLVNAHGRTPEEICAIISQKAYGKLF